MFKQIIVSLDHWYVEALKSFGYPAIALMMAIESSIFPLPSEIVIPPAAYRAHTGEIPLGIVGIVIAGAIGSWIGASVMYWASRLAGRPLILRYGRYVMISEAKVEGAERWAAHYGSMGIFISRLLPVVRHLIGIPAGVVKMNYWAFSIYTVLGSAIWCAALSYIGIKAGGALTKGQYHVLCFWLGGAVVGLGAVYYAFVHRQMRVKAAPAVERPE